MLLSQNVVISGKVTDSLQQPLTYVNILAMPQSDDAEVSFTITKDDGSYKLVLAKQQTYELIISYLGFKTQKLQLTTTDQDLHKDVVLYESPDQLDEVTLNYTPPVTVKKDTVIYLTDKFVTGEERKLRDVLKKLPGVEVDREGNVTANGKRVTKVLVEGKIFFTGNSKLAVNNIPADAVDKVEILDNYNEVAMLKGLQDSDNMAMNIKLKEDKKKFAFGDVEVGGGIKERYIIHPNLFYYSPDTNVNFIGDLNNTGVKSFEFRDYLEFEGGFGKLLTDTKAYFNLYNSDFAQYLNNQDFTSNTNRFGALNIRQSLGKHFDIGGYLIASNSDSKTLGKTQNIYLNDLETFEESRTTANTLNNDFVIGKVTLDYDPSFNEDFAYNTVVKVTNNHGIGMVTTINPSQNNSINTITDVTALDIKQNLSYSRKLSKDHTATLEATYTFQNNKPLTEWQTTQQILQGLIPLEDDEVYSILQEKRTKSHTFSGIVKDYWEINNFNHIYTSVGINTAFNSLYSNDFQEFSDGSINNFDIAGFGNDFKYNFVDTYLGLEYKFQIGKVIFKPMVYWHFYNWQTQQRADKQNNHKNLVLPQFTTKVEFNNSEKLNFRYRLNVRFPTMEHLANRFMLSDFNTVFKGNAALDNQLYHSVFLSYYKFSMFRGLNLNFSTSFNKRLKTFKYETQLQGIEQYSSPVLLDQSEHNWNLNGMISKKIRKIRYNLSASFVYNDFYQILNNDTRLNISKTTSTTVSAETSFKNWPNIEVGYTKDFSNYRSSNTVTRFQNDLLFVELQYDFLNDFIFKTDYNFDSYTNKTTELTNTFEIANASLFYQKEDSPWGFEVEANNIFDVGFKQQNSFNSFLISDSKTFVMPRMIMFKVSYKL